MTCSGEKSRPNRDSETSATFLRLLLAASSTGHRRRGSNADDIIAEGVTAAANQYRDVGPLSPPVGVQLVEYEELQPLRSSHKLPIFASSEQQLEHHVVGEKDVRRLSPESHPATGPFPARCIVRNRTSDLSSGKPLVDELAQFFVLTVGESVHWIDDDCLNSPARAISKHMVHNRNDVGETLSRTSASREDTGLAFVDFPDRFALVLVQEKLLSNRIHIGFFDSENPRAFLPENSLQRPDRQ